MGQGGFEGKRAAIQTFPNLLCKIKAPGAYSLWTVWKMEGSFLAAHPLSAKLSQCPFDSSLDLFFDIICYLNQWYLRSCSLCLSIHLNSLLYYTGYAESNAELFELQTEQRDRQKPPKIEMHIALVIWYMLTPSSCWNVRMFPRSQTLFCPNFSLLIAVANDPKDNQVWRRIVVRDYLETRPLF